jgi:hypothetical protein
MRVSGTKTMKLLVAAVFGIALTMETAPASAAVVVVPSANTSVEGNSNNGFPFSLGNFGLTAQRWQQVYAASQFGNNAGNITQIRFRPDAAAGSPFSMTLPNVQINFSVTPAAPGALSLTYANNIGGPQTTVYSGALSLSSAFTGPAAGPKDFDIVINLQTPFFYNPALGNLLIEVKNFADGTTNQFDAQIGSGVASRVYNLDNNPNAVTGTTADNSALVTKFVFADDLLQISYAANLGAGQSVVNLTNAGTNGGNDTTDYICANVYVFAQDQQLISCCACPLSPNDLQTLSVQNDLINNTLTPGVPTGVTIAVLASDDTGKTGCNAATVDPAKLVSGLRAWGTKLHAAPGGGFSVTETPFSKVGLGGTGAGSEFAKMTSFCGFIQADGSKFGMCNSCTPGAQGAQKQ